jgi:hypothetical protein
MQYPVKFRVHPDHVEFNSEISRPLELGTTLMQVLESPTIKRRFTPVDVIFEYKVLEEKVTVVLDPDYWGPNYIELKKNSAPVVAAIIEKLRKSPNFEEKTEA